MTSPFPHFGQVTPVVITNSDAYKENLLCIGQKVENGTTIISLEESNLSLNSI